MAPIFYLNISALNPADRYILYQDDYKTRKGIPALPFSIRRETVHRPKPLGYPKELKTIGDHIRKWRMDRGLRIVDVARLLGVTEDTVINWEVRGVRPVIRLMPKIIQMLRYLPIEIDITSLPGSLSYIGR